MNTETAQNHEQKGVFQGQFHEKTKNFLRASKNPIYTEELFSSIDEGVKLLASYPDKTTDGFMLAGSFARYLTGNGDQQTNWLIRQKAKEMHTTYIHNPEHIKDFTRISGPDQDIDTTYVFTPNGSLDTLFAFIKSNTNATEHITTALTPEGKEIQKKHLDYADLQGTNVHLEFGPIVTNPKLIHMTMGFYKDKARLFHIDIAKFPSDGMEALTQKRIGGGTIEAQDIYLPITLDEQGKTIYTIHPSKTYSVLHKERINTKGKDKDIEPIDVAELSARALRIHLIHSERLFTDASTKKLTQLFYTDEDGNIFDIRKCIQSVIRTGEPLPKEKLDLLRTELLISMANDPYETARFLQDTGIYLLIPGLKNFTQKDWKNLFTSTAFTFLREGEPMTRSNARSMDSVRYSHNKFKLVKWNEGVNGIQRFIRAFGEAMKEKMPDLDLKNYDQMYALLFKTESPQTIQLEKQDNKNLQNILLSLFKTYPSGITERELHNHLKAITKTKISRAVLREELFYIKSRGLINRQSRLTADKKNVVFYSPRLTKNNTFDYQTIPLTHQEIHDAISKMQIPNVDAKTKNVLEQVLQKLPCRSIESFRPLRSYDREYLVEIMNNLIQSEGSTPSKGALTQFIDEIQQACIAFSKKRGL